MGRGKLILKLIDNEKSRMTTYEKRKRGLKKKAEEFATLCGVPTCMIIYGPKLKNRPPEVDVWPKDASDFMEVVNLYRDKGFSSSRGTKAYNLLDFFSERKRKADDKLNKMRRSNLESKFPSSWDDRLDGFSVDQLRVLLVTFDNNIEVARRKIAIMKGDDQNAADCSKLEIQSHTEVKPLDSRQFYHHHQPVHMLPYDFNNLNDHNQMMIGGGGDHNLPQFCGGGGGQVVLQPTLYFDSPAVMINNQGAMYFYGATTATPTQTTLQQHYEQQQHCPPLPLPPPPPLASNMHGHGGSQSHHHYQFNELYRDMMNEFVIKNPRG